MVLVLPLVLRRFSVEEFAAWALFSIVIGMQMLAEMGFGPTFARVIAYGMGGAERLANLGETTADIGGGKGPNWRLIGRIVGTMSWIYNRLSWGLLGTLATLGSVAVMGPLSRIEHPRAGWTAWVIIVAVSAVSLRSKLCVAVLQGINEIALLRRWETWFGIGSIASSFVVLILGGGLLALVSTNQAWVFCGAVRNALLIRSTLGPRLDPWPRQERDLEIMACVWPGAWRSAIGSAMSYGLLQVSGILVGQSKDAGVAGGYLLSLRLIQPIVQISAAPFYSKLPVLAKRFAGRDLGGIRSLAMRGMRLAYWSFCLPFCGLTLLGPWLLGITESKTAFPDSLLWVLLGTGYFLERYGAMHVQLYSLSNHIVWHVANGVTGAIMVATWLALAPVIGMLAYPVGMVIGYSAFYCWYCSAKSHRLLSLGFPRFDLLTAGLPALVMAATCGFALLAR